MGAGSRGIEGRVCFSSFGHDSPGGRERLERIRLGLGRFLEETQVSVSAGGLDGFTVWVPWVQCLFSGGSLVAFSCLQQSPSLPRKSFQCPRSHKGVSTESVDVS